MLSVVGSLHMGCDVTIVMKPGLEGGERYTASSSVGHSTICHWSERFLRVPGARAAPRVEE